VSSNFLLLLLSCFIRPTDEAVTNKVILPVYYFIMKSVLIVDDELGMREMVKQLLLNEACHVLEASNGKHAMEFLKNESPELVITDIIMEEMDGVEIIFEIRENYPDIKIIAMSGGSKISSEDYLESASDLGADRIFNKPFALSDMLNAIKELIEE